MIKELDRVAPLIATPSIGKICLIQYNCGTKLSLFKIIGHLDCSKPVLNTQFYNYWYYLVPLRVGGAVKACKEENDLNVLNHSTDVRTDLGFAQICIKTH